MIPSFSVKRVFASTCRSEECNKEYPVNTELEMEDLMEEERTINNNATREKKKVLELYRSMVNKSYYVCNLCSDIFISPEKLKIHEKLQHKVLQLQLSESSESEVDNEKPEDSSVDTDPEDERPAPATVKKRRKRMRTKLRIIHEMRSMVKNQAAKVNRQGPGMAKETTSSKQTPSSSNKSNAKEWTCSKCRYSCKSNSNYIKNHILSHHYSDFRFILPSCPPYTCPECHREVRDKITLTRHYAFTHKKLFEVTNLTEEKLKQMMKA